MTLQEYGAFETMNISFSNTKPNEKVSLSGTYIDFIGDIYGPKSSSIIIQGGDDKGQYAVNQYEAGGFYMTQNQRRTLTKILQGMASYSDRGFVTSSNGQLQEMCNTIYRNYIG
ncbi:MAG: hypothetical protein COA52_00445 [Hyphomicrobiales bacterium]|nr:MAG: hypothetical protein COA52_00445 [Hyphomicrobiales bacterium]